MAKTLSRTQSVGTTSGRAQRAIHEVASLGLDELNSAIAASRALSSAEKVERQDAERRQRAEELAARF